MPDLPGSTRAADLASDLDEAVERFLRQIDGIEADAWNRLPGAGVWSVGKDVEHVIEAIGYHRWIVESTIGRPVGSKRPALERKQLTSGLSPADAVRRVRRTTAESRALILGLTDDQLALPTKPPRAGSPPLAATIERVLIGHFDAHRADVEAKLRA